ncbi:Uncharacterized damage-inducible protein DinB (forms a four-helix bundle) [Paenibacillus tianmuensis]|uniref:Uncharacterized damage-inducible protein DinB (Forms a four-helix bundle) n=1 Tax=Paenibacillus tianmuensis TaxID=624147 RepID=A0A1G4QZX9_9BACL|nr:DinB family protein [Paenibacillus tianmuensis]SCW50184.1 Uncharacterized damage-inducible protein DinB (forms a four-helix bundle) [Paenibacillus tianmuensis]
MSQAILNTALKVRGMVLNQVNSIPEELFDIQPVPFNNTIRWNVGHIVAALDGFLSLGTTFNSNLPESYPSLFGMTSKPSDWTTTPPSKEELVRYLSQQLDALSKFPIHTLEDKPETPIQLGPMTFETVGELFNFAFVHETMHNGSINYILRAINHEQNK